MVRHGIKGLVGGGAAIMAEGPIQAYQRVANDMGHDLKLGENLTIGVAFYLAKTREQALSELRELARGIHPAVLTDQGLCAAFQ